MECPDPVALAVESWGPREILLLSMIDLLLAQYRHASLASADRVIDDLLDLRNVLTD